MSRNSGPDMLAAVAAMVTFAAIYVGAVFGLVPGIAVFAADAVLYLAAWAWMRTDRDSHADQ